MRITRNIVRLNTLYVEKAEFSNVTTSGSYNYHLVGEFNFCIHVLIRMKCETKVGLP